MFRPLTTGPLANPARTRLTQPVVSPKLASGARTRFAGMSLSKAAAPSPFVTVKPRKEAS